eukprot:3694971-Heterocapsa_arctica.AAC.1
MRPGNRRYGLRWRVEYVLRNQQQLRSTPRSEKKRARDTTVSTHRWRHRPACAKAHHIVYSMAPWWCENLLTS